MITFNMRKSDGTIVKGVAAEADLLTQDFGYDYMIMVDNDETGVHDFMYVGKDFFQRSDIEIVEE